MNCWRIYWEVTTCVSNIDLVSDIELLTSLNCRYRWEMTVWDLQENSSILKTKHPKYEYKINIWMLNKNYWYQCLKFIVTSEHQQMIYLLKQCCLVYGDILFQIDNFSYFQVWTFFIVYLTDTSKIKIGELFSYALQCIFLCDVFKSDIKKQCTISDWDSEIYYYLGRAFCYANWMLLHFNMRSNHGQWNEEERNEKVDSKGILFIWLKTENAQKWVGTRIGEAWHLR